jgi:hypothetical protein
LRRAWRGAGSAVRAPAKAERSLIPGRAGTAVGSQRRKISQCIGWTDTPTTVGNSAREFLGIGTWPGTFQLPPIRNKIAN